LESLKRNAIGAGGTLAYRADLGCLTILIAMSPGTQETFAVACQIIQDSFHLLKLATYWNPGLG
jgi:methyl coenzyme M reductase subunit C